MTTSRRLARRWLPVVLGTLLAAVFSWSAYASSADTFEARGTVVLLPPRTVVSAGGNPFLVVGVLEQPAAVVAARVEGTFQSRAGEQLAEVSVDRDPTTRGPVLAITARSETASGAMAGLVDATDAIPTELAALEESMEVGSGASVRVLVLSTDSAATRVSGGSVPMAVVAGGTWFGVTLVAHGLARRRRPAQPAGSDATLSSAGSPGSRA